MTRPIATLLLLLGLIAGAAATAPDEPLPVDEAFAMEAT